MKHRSSDDLLSGLKGNDTSTSNARSTCELASTLNTRREEHTMRHRLEFENPFNYLFNDLFNWRLP